MPSKLAERLSAARHRRFVGRASELALLQSALAAEVPPFHVLFVFGPGGVGKTTLIVEFARLCRQAAASATYLDARHVEPSPESFLEALQLAMGLRTPESPLRAIGSAQRSHVLFIDTCEALAPLDDWLRESFLPQLPANALVVLAGRQPPSPAWRADAGWQTLVRVLPLRNLSPDESRAYLAKRRIPANQHAAVLSFTHGHPLALSLVADVFSQRRDTLTEFQPEAAPDIVKALLEQFVQKVPGPAHRAALEACALVRVTTEAVLAEMLAMPDVHELFQWLRGLSFIEAGSLGVYPHDLAREALAADVRWRNPDWYAELHRRARSYYAARLGRDAGQAQQRVLADYIFLHRDNPVVRPFFEWQTAGSAFTDLMKPEDVPALVDMVARHEGAASSRLAAHWFERQPEAVLVVRGPRAQPAAFVAAVALERAQPQDLEADPAARAAWGYLRGHAPLRPGEVATLFRFWMSADTYQAVSPSQSHIFVNMVRHYLTTPGLAFTFLPCAEPEFWAPMFAYADLARIAQADFEVGGRRYGVYGHDWRAVPPTAWLALLADRETGRGGEPSPPPAEPLIVLSEAEFSEAVRDVLRDIRDGRDAAPGLGANPLLRSRLVRDRVAAEAAEAERASALQAVVTEAVEAFRASPRSMKQYRALYHTYLHPAGSQEQTAELLDIPFSTYRRHLKTGFSRLVASLWRRETGAHEK